MCGRAGAVKRRRRRAVPYTVLQLAEEVVPVVSLIIYRSAMLAYFRRRGWLVGLVSAVSRMSRWLADDVKTAEPTNRTLLFGKNLPCNDDVQTMFSSKPEHWTVIPRAEATASHRAGAILSSPRAVCRNACL